MSSTASMYMALGQLYTNHIHDSRLLNVLVATPREHFVPERYAHTAYVDAPLPLSPTRTMLAPQTQAAMLREARLSSTDNVLILPAGRGYLAAVAAQLASTIIALESEVELVKAAQTQLAELSPRVQVKQVQRVLAGFAEHGPYDAIIVEGALRELPHTLIQQLVPEEGRLVYASPISGASAGVRGRARVMVTQLGAGGLRHHALEECVAPCIDADAVSSAR